MSVNQNNVILRFDNISFAYDNGSHPILVNSSFSIRENTKITIMGQNGAGKSTIFKLITGELNPQNGKINIVGNSTIAMSRQVVSRDHLGYDIKQFFETAFEQKDYQLDKKINDVLSTVNLNISLDKKIGDLSGGQQARILLAYALIQHPDILLLDEPTNNLDKKGINDLIGFLLSYDKTVIVISHDADFLNLFTDGVLYLNKDRCDVEQYRGNYYDVVEQITAQIEKEQMQNARAEKKILDAKEKINFFSNKGGKMRKLASKMREEVELAEDNKIDVRKDDKTIPKFIIPFDNYVGPIITINSVSLINNNHEIKKCKLFLELKKGDRHILVGPNGIGKTTLLKKLVRVHRHKDEIIKDFESKIKYEENVVGQGPDTYHPEQEEAMIYERVKVGYYSQDFNDLDMNMNVWDALHEANDIVTDEKIYRVASQFLLRGNLLKNKIGSLSEGQKGLLCYARFVIQEPHLLILDEPTNHINFRHIPIIAQAINDYQGAILMISHDQVFVEQISKLHEVDLGRLI